MRLYAIPAAILLTIVQAGPAWALDMEFYTYGGFNAVANAFRQVALILNDSGFTGLFFVVAVLGILFGGIAFFMRMIGGFHLDPVSWTWPIMLGMAVYMAAVVPKGSLTIYDPVLNRFETISDIPDGVVLVAGTLNKIERGLVEIIDTAAAPTAKYAQGAGGIGFTAVRHIMDADIKNAYLKQSLGRYMADCVLFEMSRPGTALTLNGLVNGNNDYLPELAKAVNPAVYTVYFDPATPNGRALTCTESWTALNLFLSNTANFSSAINAAAGRTLFDPANVAETNQFKTLITDTIQQTTGLAITPEVAARQGIISRVLFQVLQEGDPSLAMTIQANRQATQSGVGMLVAANEWLPIIKAVLTTVAIGLIPILLLFIPTPLIGKALGIIVGFFLFLASWGVTDSIVHSAAMNAAAQAFEEIRQSGLALDACLMFPEVSTKTLAMFGTIRSGGILLASMLTMMLVHFGGHALSALAGNLTGQMQGAGAAAGAIASPEGKASATSGLVAAATTDSWHNSNRFDFNKAAAAGANLRGADMGRGSGMGGIGRAADAAEFGAYKDTAVNQASRERLDQQQEGWQGRLDVHAGQQAQQLSGAVHGNEAVERQFGPGAIEQGSSFAAAAANTGNLAKGGSEQSLGKAMAQSWANGLMEVGKTDETIANFVDKEFGGNYELAGAAMAMVQNQQTLGNIDSARAFANEMNRQHPGLNMTERDAMRMLGAANHMRFSGAAAYAAAESHAQGGPNWVTADNSHELISTGETSTRAGIGQAHATEDKAHAIGASVEAQQRGEHRNVGAHAIDSQSEANLLNKTFGGNKNWTPVQIGDRVGYSLGADGKATTVEVQKAGSSNISRFDTSTDRTQNVVDQSNSYTGPITRETFASPGGLVSQAKDHAGQVVQGSVDGTVEQKQVITSKDPDGNDLHSFAHTTMSPDGTVGFVYKRGGDHQQQYHHRVENSTGWSFSGLGSGLAATLVENITGSKETGESAGRIFGGAQNLASDLRSIGTPPMPGRSGSGSTNIGNATTGNVGGQVGRRAPYSLRGIPRSQNP